MLLWWNNVAEIDHLFTANPNKEYSAVAPISRHEGLWDVYHSMNFAKQPEAIWAEQPKN